MIPKETTLLVSKLALIWNTFITNYANNFLIKLSLRNKTEVFSCIQQANMLRQITYKFMAILNCTKILSNCNENNCKTYQDGQGFVVNKDVNNTIDYC